MSMGEMSDNKKEEAYLQAFIKMLKDLTKGGDRLNGAQLKGVEGMTKWMTQMTTSSKNIKSQITLGQQNYDLGKKQQKIDIMKKKMDEVQIRLRHGYKLQEEKEHGEQVRRNIQLRQMHEGFTAGFNMLKKSLFGGFGFQAAIGETVKKMAGMTRNFNELQVANTKLYDATTNVRVAEDELENAVQMPEDKDGKKEAAIKKADIELFFAKQDQVRAQSGVNSATDLAKGTQGKMTKPIFEKLGKLGDFLGKKAVPIGIGMGVAGILMSVIVKAFSASPLFAAMMKMMKFMVTLILMPIGTFFGALLRPILIMLLRKFIIPFYSSMMPTLMGLGTKVGDAIVKFLEDPWGTLWDAIWGGKKKKELTEEQEAQLEEEGALKAYNDLSDEDRNWIKWWNDRQAEWDLFWKNPVESVSAYGEESELTEEEKELEKIRAEEERVRIEHEKELQENPTVQWDMSGENPMYNGKKPSDLIPDWEAIEREAGMYPVEQEERDRAAAKEQLEKEAREAAQNEQNAIMKNQVETGGIIEDALAPIAELTENPRFVGTAMEGKLSSIHNAGISEGAYEAANAPSGHSISDAGRAILEAAGMTGGITAAADGFNGMINKPTMFLAGEAGSEHVTITPNGGSGGSGGITVNIQNMNGSDNDLRKLKKVILEVIQESSSNRGRL